MVVAEAARGQTTINQKAAAIIAHMVVALETAAAVAAAAAMVGGPLIKYLPSAPFFQFLVRPPYQKFLFSELWRWVRDRRFMTNWASTTRPPNCHPCTFSCMQYWFQSRDASSVPLEDPDRGTDEAAVCSGKCTQC